MQSLLNRANAAQICYVVRDLDEACARLHRLYGLGPFVGGARSELTDHVHRGNPAPPAEIRVAFVQSGAMNIELVQPLSRTPSAFRDMFGPGEEGLHHVAFFCMDYERDRDALVAAGFPVASEFTISFGCRVCYIDARNPLGHMIELFPEDPMIRSVFRQTREAGEAWDGRHRIVPFAR